MASGRPRGIVAGFLADGLGLGQAAVGYAHALACIGYDVSLHVLAQPGREPALGAPGAGGTIDPLLDLASVGVHGSAPRADRLQK